MKNDTKINTEIKEQSKKQIFFVKYILLVLIDLVILGLFDEFWKYVELDSFSMALIAALLLQIMLKLTLALEHKVAGYFKKKPGTLPKVLRFLSAWAILFVSKILILEAISYAFGDHVQFLGPVHGLVSFIVVVIVILIAEGLLLKLYKKLA
ncbi:MAG: hypothetical protein L3J09_08315 [Flavobacteriaceae bacterium]|nr:hypothetical protein [Flavobacteriaceae bacterium]